METNRKQQIKLNAIKREQRKLKALLLYAGQFYTVRDTAKAIGLNEKTMAKWIKANNWEALRSTISIETAEKRLERDKMQTITPTRLLANVKACIVANSLPLALTLAPIINDYLKTLPNYETNN